MRDFNTSKWQNLAGFRESAGKETLSSLTSISTQNLSGVGSEQKGRLGSLGPRSVMTDWGSIPPFGVGGLVNPFVGSQHGARAGDPWGPWHIPLPHPA